MFRSDVGPCPICGAAHAACTSSKGPITVVMMPERDAAMSPPEFNPPRLVAEIVQETLPEGQVTTGTYRRKKG